MRFQKTENSLVNFKGSSITEGALDDVKVIDPSTDIAAPYCTKILAEYGREAVPALPYRQTL